MGQYTLTIVIATVLLVFIIYQQMRTRPISVRQLIIVPLFLAFLGITNLSKNPPDSTAAAVAFGASMVIALVFGLGRGFTTQIWWSNGVLLRRGSTWTLLLWIAGIRLRVVIGLIARREGVASNVTLGEVPVFFGVTLAVQNVVIWLQGQETPIRGGASPGERV
jgi:membrane protein CcdC involved in cytochrome C biogenesis